MWLLYMKYLTLGTCPCRRSVHQPLGSRSRCCKSLGWSLQWLPPHETSSLNTGNISLWCTVTRLLLALMLWGQHQHAALCPVWGITDSNLHSSHADTSAKLRVRGQNQKDCQCTKLFGGPLQPCLAQKGQKQRHRKLFRIASGWDIGQLFTFLCLGAQ